MSTRCAIGIKKNDSLNGIKWIYCHWDGYIVDGVGSTLYKNYKDEKTVDELISLGDLSTLGKLPIADAKAWTELDNDDYEGCRAYFNRPGLEEPKEIHRCDYEKFKDLSYDYKYLFDNGKWIVIKDRKEKDLDKIFNPQLEALRRRR